MTRTIREEIGKSRKAFEEKGVMRSNRRSALGINGVLCLMGVSTDEKPLEICADCLNMQMVLGNKMVFGTVSSNRGHFERSIEVLVLIEEKWPGWLSKLITRRLTLDNFTDGLHPTLDNIKTVVELI